ncbi:glutaredoxin family protein [Rhodococcus globerulus]|uniref:glutaredoxin family protein n=1 Tax=Rhodococcus globerulus TaxID=33008 RepID=UPI0027A9F06A
MTQPVVTVYTKPGCQPCRMTKRQLDKLGVEHVTADISVDAAAEQRVKDLGYLGVPVVTAGDMHWHGYVPDKCKQVAHALANTDPISALTELAAHYLDKQGAAI